MPWRRHSSQLEGTRTVDPDALTPEDRRRSSDEREIEHERRVQEMREFLEEQHARLRSATEHS